MPRTINFSHRQIDLCKNFGVQIKVIINKYNISQDKSFEIEKYCKSNNIEVLGKIPFDEDVVKSIAQGIPLVKFSKGPAAKAIKAIEERLIDICP